MHSRYHERYLYHNFNQIPILKVNSFHLVSSFCKTLNLKTKTHFIQIRYQFVIRSFENFFWTKIWIPDSLLKKTHWDYFAATSIATAEMIENRVKMSEEKAIYKLYPDMLTNQRGVTSFYSI